MRGGELPTVPLHPYHGREDTPLAMQQAPLWRRFSPGKGCQTRVVIRGAAPRRR